MGLVLVGVAWRSVGGGSRVKCPLHRARTRTGREAGTETAAGDRRRPRHLTHPHVVRVGRIVYCLGQMMIGRRLVSIVGDRLGRLVLGLPGRCHPLSLSAGVKRPARKQMARTLHFE